jgi:hypothetical protein
MDKNSALEQMAVEDAITIELLRASAQNQTILAQSQAIMTHFFIAPFLDTSMQMIMTYPVKNPSPKHKDSYDPILSTSKEAGPFSNSNILVLVTFGMSTSMEQMDLHLWSLWKYNMEPSGGQMLSLNAQMASQALP